MASIEEQRTAYAKRAYVAALTNFDRAMAVKLEAASGYGLAGQTFHAETIISLEVKIPHDHK